LWKAKDEAGQRGPAPADPPPVAREKPGDANAAEPFKLELNAEMHDPQVVKAFDDLNNHWKGKYEAAEASIQMLTNAVQKHDTRQFESDFDALVGGLGDEYQGLLGKGRTSGLDENSIAYQNRMRVAEQIDTLARGILAKNPQADPRLERVFPVAINAILGDKLKNEVKTQTRQDLASRIKKRGKQIVSEPTSRDHITGGSPTHRATTFAENFYKHKGVGGDEDF